MDSLNFPLYHLTLLFVMERYFKKDAASEAVLFWANVF